MSFCQALLASLREAETQWAQTPFPGDSNSASAFTLLSFTPVPKFYPLKNVGENFDYCEALHLVSKSKAVGLWLDFKTSAPQGCPSDDRRDGSRGGKSAGNVSKVESSRNTAIGLSASGSLL